MATPYTHFRPDDRHILVVEEADDMAAAEKAADIFLQEISQLDEGGATYQRIQVSGIARDGKYYFNVIVHN